MHDFGGQGRITTSSRYGNDDAIVGLIHPFMLLFASGVLYNIALLVETQATFTMFP